MTITNENVEKLRQALYGIIGTGAQLPIWLHYAISKNISRLDSLWKIKEKSRMTLVDMYSVKDEKTGKTHVPPENLEKFRAPYDELMAQPNEVDFHKVNYGRLENEVKTLAGVPNMHLVFEYMVDEESVASTAENGNLHAVKE